MHTRRISWVLVSSFLLACFGFLIAPTITLGQDEGKRFGTGFVVSIQGHILTNNHVVAGCRTIATREGKPLQVLSRNASSDLALLQANFVPSTVAVFRTGAAPKLGDEVVAFGFPLPGLLSSDGNVSAGILSATTGIQNDVRFIQISAPVQPGNSGGPLFDSSGHVIGVIVSKLDAVKIAQLTGDVPQNVNFAVNLAEVRAFLDDAATPYQKEISQHAIPTSSIAATATQVAIAIECVPTDSTPQPSESAPKAGSSRSAPSAKEGVWTSINTGKDYKVRIDGDYIYLQWTNMSEDFRSHGVFIRAELKKTGDKWVGKEIRNWPCRFEVDMEIDEVSETRIEGKNMTWPDFNARKCQPKYPELKQFTWIPK
jgi:S1-C subfamily serine protease